MNNIENHKLRTSFPDINIEEKMAELIAEFEESVRQTKEKEGADSTEVPFVTRLADITDDQVDQIIKTIGGREVKVAEVPDSVRIIRGAPMSNLQRLIIGHGKPGTGAALIEIDGIPEMFRKKDIVLKTKEKVSLVQENVGSVLSIQLTPQTCDKKKASLREMLQNPLHKVAVAVAFSRMPLR